MNRRRREILETLAVMVTAKPGDELAGYRLVRKGVSNDCFGWWVVATHEGRYPPHGEGFISLPNLVAEMVRRRSE